MPDSLSSTVNVDADKVQIDGDVVGRDNFEIHAETVNFYSGTSIPNRNRVPEPSPQYDPKLTLEAPQGAVPLASPFYIERTSDQDLRQRIFGQGTTTTIRAGRQTGKTSLLMRGIQEAKRENQTVVYLDFQTIETARRETLDGLLQHLAQDIACQLSIELERVNNIWKSPLGALKKFSQLLEDVVLPSTKVCLLAMDEADQLLGAAYKTDFFAMVRSWNTLQASDPVWRKLNVVMIISTHPHLLIDNSSQSPFNVQQSIDLKDFDEAQVRELNSRHGHPIADGSIDSAMKLLGGHPYLTRQALYSLISQPLTWDKLMQTAASDHSPFGRHLRYYWNELQKQPQLVNAMKYVIEQRKFEDDTILYRLAACGLIKEVGEKYVCRCGLYEAYFKEKLR